MLFAIILAVALPLSGCMTPDPAPADGTPSGPPAGARGPTSDAPSDLLAGLPVPAKATRVSDGGEPMILADMNGKFLWIADTSGVYYSTDNGTRWQETTGYLGDFGGALTDGPGLAQDEQGRLYKASLHDNRGDVARSDDGKSFGQASYFAGYPIDRPWIAARGSSVVVVYLNNFGAIGYQEACTRSTDAGAMFTDRNPAAGTPGTGGLYMAPDKSFYFSGDRGIITRHDQTCSDTTTFGASTVQMFPSVGVNNLYAMTGFEDKLFAAAAGSGNKMQVSGLTKWGAKPKVYAVSPEALKTNTFGAVAARGNDVAVAWYGSTTEGDPSADGFRGSFHVYVALIRDYFGEQGQTTIQLWKVSEEPNHEGTICMGGVTCTGNRGLLDYFGVAIDVWGGIHVAYVDDTGDTTTYHSHIVPEGDGMPIDEPIQLPSPGAGPTQGTGTGTGGAGSGSRPVAKIRGEVLGLKVMLDGSGSSGKSPLTYRWDLGDGTFESERTINHTYASAGQYKVRLTVRDTQGLEASTSATIDASEGHSGQVSDEGGRGSPGAGLILVGAAALVAMAFVRRRA